MQHYLLVSILNKYYAGRRRLQLYTESDLSSLYKGLRLHLPSFLKLSKHVLMRFSPTRVRTFIRKLSNCASQESCVISVETENFLASFQLCSLSYSN